MRKKNWWMENWAFWESNLSHSLKGTQISRQDRVTPPTEGNYKPALHKTREMKTILSWECTSVVECSPSMCKALGSILNSEGWCLKKSPQSLWAWGYTPIIPALRKLRQEDQQIWGQPGLLSKTLSQKTKRLLTPSHVKNEKCGSSLLILFKNIKY
jgi:hypothetical protein